MIPTWMLLIMAIVFVIANSCIFFYDVPDRIFLYVVKITVSCVLLLFIYCLLIELGVNLPILVGI